MAWRRSPSTTGWVISPAPPRPKAMPRMRRPGPCCWEAVDKRGGTTAVAENTLNTWLDVDHAFEACSEQLASRLQELGACRRGTRRGRRRPAARNAAPPPENEL